MKLSEAIAAIERGEEVEYKGPGDSWWTLTDNLGFTVGSAINWSFRLKPKPKPVEPIRAWANIYKDDECIFYQSEEEARLHSHPTATRVAVPFREVAPLTEEEVYLLEEIKAKRIGPETAVGILLDLLKKQGVE